MFDLTGEDIALLNDEDLRTLVARLCEAEIQKLGGSTAGVTAGGDQNAPDGGLDVRVELAPALDAAGYIPRTSTGIQVKVPNMPASAIKDEMRPDGELRSVIAELAACGGAYIIVSANGSTSDKALQNRREAMRDALADCPDAESLHTDFYDRTRIATWVRTFPGLENWVRNRIGRPLRGWRPYENWSNRGEPIGAEYLLDDQSRLHDSRTARDEALTMVEGIDRLRGTLANRGSVVRLIGLSGLGKTRLLQALFDERVGDNALDATLAIYADIADALEPSAREMARELVRRGERAILLVDNCPPETHRALAQECSVANSSVSLVTVEYDVRDDEPEGSEVFRLEPASDEVIERLIERRNPHILPPARRRLAEFSGGNARVALALAQTVGRGETLSDLSDAALFRRLFHQRNPEDEGLLQAAEACALVYSFDGETLSGDDAELPVLAPLADQPVERLHRHIAELKRRSLVQHRGRWRAVLPHALANLLAKQALENIPTERLQEIILAGPPRLVRSHSRRLGYLHDSDAATAICEAWLGADGMLGDPTELSPLGVAMFFNVAPVSPERALDAIERAVSGDNGAAFLEPGSHGRDQWTRLLRALAYDPALFDRAARTLSKFVLAEPKDQRNSTVKDAFVALFHLHLSGTHATREQRLALVRSLTSSPEEAERRLGLFALDAMFQASHFSSTFDLDFGARPRDYGWQPQTWDDVQHWFEQAIEHAKRLILEGGPAAAHAKTILATNFRSLWNHSRANDALEATCAEIAALTEWNEGWIAIRTTLRFEGKEQPEMVDRLRRLEDILRPKDLLATARAFLSSRQWSALDIADGDEDAGEEPVKAHEGAQLKTAELGSQIAQSPELLAVLLPEATGGNPGRPWDFGKGLALGARDPSELWSTIRAAYAAHDPTIRNDSLAAGFMNGLSERDKPLANALLNDALADAVFGPMFPRLQLAAGLDALAGERLLGALELGAAPSWQFSYLTLGRCTDDLPSDTLGRIVLRLAENPDGFPVALSILGQRLHSARDANGAPLDEALLKCGRELLCRAPFKGGDPMGDHYMAALARACLSGTDGEDAARRVAENFADALNDYRATAYEFNDFLSELFRTHPTIALDAILLRDGPDGHIRGAADLHFHQRRPFDVLSDNTILTWASKDAARRAPLLAEVVSVYTSASEEGDCEWTPLGLSLLELAPDKLAYLEQIGFRLHPRGGWSNSLANILEKRRPLLAQLQMHDDPVVAQWARDQDAALQKWIADERARERRGDESFE